MKAKSNKEMAWSVIFIIQLAVLDQLTKYLAVLFLKGKEPFVLIRDVLELRYLENQSAAFGVDLLSILQNLFHFSYFEEHPEAFLNFKMAFFVLLTLLVIAFFLWIYRRIPHNRHFGWANAVVIVFCAGAVGNGIDRLFYHYVIDFIYFKLIDFPIFNVADIYVTVSVFSLIILSFFYYKEADFEVIFPPKKKASGKDER